MLPESVFNMLKKIRLIITCKRWVYFTIRVIKYSIKEWCICAGLNIISLPNELFEPERPRNL